MEVAIQGRDLDLLKSNFEAAKNAGEDEEYLMARVDRLLRERALALVEDDGEDDRDGQTDALRAHLQFAQDVTRNNFSVKGTPVSVLSDVFETHRVTTCEALFVLVEENLTVWKQPPFSDSSQSAVLRMCNDLVKRVSRSISTKFCGRILSFLSRFLPLTEKSGLNHMGHFNTDNVTNFEATDVPPASESAPNEEDMEVGEIVETKETIIPVDQALYVKFWSMQKHFSDPSSVYDRITWKNFQKNSSEVLNVFASYKLERSTDDDDDSNSKRRRKDDGEARAALNKASDDAEEYFAKYLTSPKLFQLQLNDSQFRRCFLLQSLILFQYLVSDVRTKPKTAVLNEEQLRFVVESQDKCYKLLRETHPRGAHFAESVKRILQREEKWNAWKNSQCPDYTQYASKEPMKNFRKREREKYDPAKTDLGSAELTKLWNIEPDMLTACRDVKRRFMPALEDFVRDVVDEDDPEQQVEEQYKSINDTGFQWRAARILLAESPCYLGVPLLPQGEKVIKPLKTFVKDSILNTAKRFPDLKAQMESWTAKKEDIDLETAKRKVQESILKKVEEGSSSPMSDVDLDEERIKALVTLLAPKWRVLALSTNVDEKEIGILEKNITEKKYSEPAIVDSILREQLEAKGSTIRTVRNLLLEANLLTEEITKVLRAAPS